MKTFFVLAAASLAVVNAVECDLIKVSPLLTDVDVKQCGADTGLSPPVPASADVLPKLCGNKACLAALAKLKGLGVGDCVVAGIALETDFINPIEAYCAKATPASTPATGTSPAPAGASPTPTTAAPGSTPAPTTKAPTATTATTSGSKADTTIQAGSSKGDKLTSSGSDSKASTTIQTPSKTTPAPTPKSGAASVAFAASAVVLAVAAAFM